MKYYSCLAQMRICRIDIVVCLPYCIQVPTSLWADDWHFTVDGLKVFAAAFANDLVHHLRGSGMQVEGSGPRYRARAC